jgi:hypothetical protein
MFDQSYYINMSIYPVMQECYFTIPNKASVYQTGVLMIRQPICIYNNWSTYDELSDNIVLTEELAMKELDEVLRLRKAGVRIDYYLMDAFWYAPDGGYREANAH